MSIHYRYFEKGSYWHIYNKSIANYPIFRSIANKKRFSYTLDYYNSNKRPTNLAKVLKINCYQFIGITSYNSERIVKILCYCIMPDHYHLLLKVMNENCVPDFISNIQNSYTRYFNQKYKRKGPLWQSRFKCVCVVNNDQLLHVSRYIHLNPTTAGLVSKPEDWLFSSYNNYLFDPNFLKQNTEISIQNISLYKRFTESRIEYQKKLKKIKKLLLD